MPSWPSTIRQSSMPLDTSRPACCRAALARGSSASPQLVAGGSCRRITRLRLRRLRLEAVSAATRPSHVFPRPGALARVAVRRRLLLRGDSSCAEPVRRCSPPPDSAASEAASSHLEGDGPEDWAFPTMARKASSSAMRGSSPGRGASAWRRHCRPSSTARPTRRRWSPSARTCASVWPAGPDRARLPCRGAHRRTSLRSGLKVAPTAGGGRRDRLAGPTPRGRLHLDRRERQGALPQFL
jgi:hypothetical protein